MGAITITDERQSDEARGANASLTIPARYLPEARVALMQQIDNDADWVKSVIDSQDLEGALNCMQGDLGLHRQLRDATTDIELIDDPSHSIETLLEGIIRKAVVYLQEEAEYGPLPRAEMTEIVDRMRWALTELDRYFAVQQQSERKAA